MATAALPLPSTLTVVDHPLIRHKLSLLRDARVKPKQFRELVTEVASLVGYPVTAQLDLIETKMLDTPVAPFQAVKLKDEIALFPILRAGLGLVDGFLHLLPSARVYHLGLYRDKTTLLPVEYYNKLPPQCGVDLGIVLDPMIATAGTAIAAVNVLKDWGLKRIKLVGVVGSRHGVEQFYAAHPDVEIYLGALDDDLTNHGYISPGLGDAGDRLFKTFHEH